MCQVGGCASPGGQSRPLYELCRRNGVGPFHSHEGRLRPVADRRLPDMMVAAPAEPVRDESPREATIEVTPTTPQGARRPQRSRMVVDSPSSKARALRLWVLGSAARAS